MEIKFPKLKYPSEVNQINQSVRLQKSINGIRTIFNNNAIQINYEQFFENFFECDYGIILLNIEGYIQNLISEYIIKKEENKLIEIFHFIQFWGGISARNIYVKNGGFDKNFCIESYKDIIEIALTTNKDTFHLDLKKIKSSSSSIKQLGISFTTKHLSFWSRYNTYGFNLPILDNIISMNLLNKCYANWRDYLTYVEEMQTEAKRNNTTVLILERELYNNFEKNKQ
jgi:hypothetical protein